MNNQDSWWMALSQHYVSAENLTVFINVNKLSVINFSLAEILQTHPVCWMCFLLLGNCFSSPIHCSGSYQHNCNSKCSNHSGLWGYCIPKPSINWRKMGIFWMWIKSEFIQVRSNLPAKFHQLFRNIFSKDLTFSLYQWGQKMCKVWRTS